MEISKRIVSTVFMTVLFILFLVPVRKAEACDGSCGNPLYYPFAVVGGVVNGAVTIVTAPIEPFCYGYQHRLWIPGHFTLYGHWIPGHWRYYR